MGEFLPLHLGASWTYENRDVPGDTYTESVFDFFVYEGHAAFRLGFDLEDHSIVCSDGQTVSIYADVDNGQVIDFDEDVIMGEFEDGHFFRVNLHNLVVESNLPAGIVPPAGAITNLEWYLRDVGCYGQMDIDAESGGIEDAYFLIDYKVSVEELQVDPVGSLQSRNHPTPFAETTTIRCHMPPSSGAVPIALRIYDIAGRLRCTLEPAGREEMGWSTYVWDGRDEDGLPVDAGVYYCRWNVPMPPHRMLLLR